MIESQIWLEIAKSFEENNITVFNYKLEDKFSDHNGNPILQLVFTKNGFNGLCAEIDLFFTKNKDINPSILVSMKSKIQVVEHIFHSRGFPEKKRINSWPNDLEGAQKRVEFCLRMAEEC